MSGAPAQAGGSKPVISGFAASPETVSSGASTTVSASVSGAETCELSANKAVSGLPETAPCGSGSVKRTLTMPTDTGKKPLEVKLTLKASGSGGATKAKTTVTVSTAGFTIGELQRISGEGAYASGELDAAAGQTVQYELVVRNTGLVTVTFGALDDTGCEHLAPGGGSRLAPGSTETFACEHVLGPGSEYTDDASIEGNEGTGMRTSNSVKVAISSSPASADEVSVGESHACAVLSGGHVDCWGDNEYGQLGDGTTIGSDTPVEVQGISTATEVGAADGSSEIGGGGFHACALLESGHVDCWGPNGSGQLGNGTYEDQKTPVEVQGISSATQITLGSYHTCALLSSGHVDCWGHNVRGQLGDGGTEGHNTPVEVQGISSATQISAGGQHTCALLSGGHVDCWGSNSQGQLGDGGTGNSDTPVEVQGVSSATQVSAGGNHTCAVLSSGQIDCWGNDSEGELGDATVDPGSDTPVEVQGISDATAVSAATGAATLANDLAAGEDTCARLSTGHIDCWGDNEEGRLGDPGIRNSDTPVEVQGIGNATEVSAGGRTTCALLSSGRIECFGTNLEGELGDGTPVSFDTPLETLGLSDAKELDTGEFQTCALLSGGHIDCWGRNRYGQIGDATVGETQDTPVEVQGIGNATQISVGGEHTCALLSSGHVECWGQDEYGQLGNGATTREPQDTPVEVHGISSAIQISAGDRHTCALLSGGHIDCWGDDAEDQLGDDSQEFHAEQNTPVEVKGISKATQVSAGRRYTCAVLSTGHVDCWGFNELGQVGNGKSGGSVKEATEVKGLSKALEVSAGGWHTCAVLSKGQVECWGDDFVGELGDGGSNEIQTTPVKADGIATATEVSAGGWHTCALLSDARIDCWGENARGQLGDGTIDEEARTPVEVPDIGAASSVSASGFHTCALLSSAEVDCWGYNDFGELGIGTGGQSDTPVEVQGI